MEQEIRAELLRLQARLTEASIAEALRLLGSDRFAELTEEHVREVMEYRPIELSGERFFERAWSRGKEAGAALGFARHLGADVVCDDLVRLSASLRGAPGDRELGVGEDVPHHRQRTRREPGRGGR